MKKKILTKGHVYPVGGLSRTSLYVHREISPTSTDVTNVTNVSPPVTTVLGNGIDSERETIPTDTRT